MITRALVFLGDFTCGLLANSIKAIVVLSFAVAIDRVTTGGGGAFSSSEVYQLQTCVLTFAFVDTFIGYVVAPWLEARRAG